MKIVAVLYPGDATGVRDSLQNFIEDRPIRVDYVMVSGGEIQSGSYQATYS